MKAFRLVAAALGALAGWAVAGALAQPMGQVVGPPVQQPGGGSLFPGSGSLFPTPIPPQTGGRDAHGDGRHRAFTGGVILYQEPEVVHDVVVVHDQPAAAPAPPPTPREPYVIGRIYKSLPGGCLKMIQGGGSYFHCGEGWYRQVGALYRAVATP